MLHPARRNPYNNSVAQALHQWLTSNGLLATAMSGEAPAEPVVLAAPVAAAPAPVVMATIGSPPTFFPTGIAPTQLAALPTKGVSGGGAVVVLYPGPDENPTAWYHYATGDWSKLVGPQGDIPGMYLDTYLTEEDFAHTVASSKAAYYAGTAAFGATYTGPLIMAAPASPSTSASVAAAPAAAGGMDPDVFAALQALVAYIKDDETKVEMTDGLMAAINTKASMGMGYWLSSATSSAFNYKGTVTQRGAYLSKLADLGLMKHYGHSSTGKKQYEVVKLGRDVAKEIATVGYATLASVIKASAGKAPKAKTPKAPQAAAVAAAAAGLTAVTAPKATAKSQKITSIVDSLGVLGPLIVEAASKVTSIVAEAGAGGISMTMKADIDSSVRFDAATANTVTFTYFKNSFATSEKTITVAVPDQAGIIASTLAQAMVYFLIYSHESAGKLAAQPPQPLPDALVVDGVPLVAGAVLTTGAQQSALPPGSVVVSGVVRYYAYPEWDTYFKPVPNPQAAAQQGIVFPAPKQPGWPAPQVAPTQAVYEELPVGTLLRTDFQPGGTGVGSSLFAVRVDAVGYQKIDTSGVVNTSSSKRPPSKLVTDAATNKATPYIVFLGKGKVETPTFYKEWIEGKRIDNADAKATEAAAQVEVLAEVLGIDPRVAALFTTKALQAMIAQSGIPYMGSTFFPPTPVPHAYPSVLLKKNPGLLGGFRSNPERYRDVVRQVLRNPRPSLRDLQDAELLDAAGLPLHDCLPRKRNPDGGLAEATDTETGIIKAVVDALKKALGSSEKPDGSTKIAQAIDGKLQGMYDTGSKHGGGVRPETGSNLGAYLRYLVAARAAGLWKNYIDPGERAVTRALGYSPQQADDPTQSIRVNEDGLSQIEAMKAAGLISGPVTPSQAMKTWLTKQKSGSGWVRADVGEPWIPSSALTPPSNYAGKMPSNSQGTTSDYSDKGDNSQKGSIQHWNTYQRAEGGGSWEGKLPYPSWAAEPWANVEGFCVDYHDVTWLKYTAGEWGASLYGYGGSGGGVKANLTNFLMRANTRDPRFVLLPGSKIKSGPMATFQEEAAIVFVSIDEKPLKIEVVSVGKNIASGAHLTTEQITAWIRARPAYPTGPKPVGPAAGIAIHRNPAPAGTRLNVREVHALLFDRSQWGPGAVRAWLTRHGMDGLTVSAAGGNWRVAIYGSDAFYPNTIRSRSVGNGIAALVGRPLK
jgi:hypothetical protein